MVKEVRFPWMFLLVLAVLLSACGQSAPAGDVTEPPDAPELPTDTPEPTAELPTDTPEPTPTASFTSTPTELPEGILFRDDFDGYLQPGWQWEVEDPDRWSFVEQDGASWLQITANDVGFGNGGQLLYRDLPEGDFEVTTHIRAEPRTNHHQANIFLFQDTSNWIVMNFGFCDHCGLSEGYGYFMETVIENNPFGDLYAVPRDASDTDVYLKLTNQGGSITGYYATEFGDWQRIGAFGNYFEFVSIGLGASNAAAPGTEVEDLVALFEYFEISIP